MEEEKKEEYDDHGSDDDSKEKYRATVLPLLREKQFWSTLLYDAKGSELYENITKQPEYYLTKTEASLIAEKMHEIAPWGTTKHILLELGAGVGEKIHPLLPAMKASCPDFLYAPVDCDGWALAVNKNRLSQTHPDIQCEIQVGLYEDMLKKTYDMIGQKTILFIGSTIGNFKSNSEVVAFVEMIKSYMKPGDRLIIGCDTPPQDGKSLEYVLGAYNTPYRDEFIMNGLDHAKRQAGLDFHRESWRRFTEW